MFERKIHDCLVSYLSQAPRPYELLKILDNVQGHELIYPVLDEIHKLVLLVHMRMMTYKESLVRYFVVYCYLF